MYLHGIGRDLTDSAAWVPGSLWRAVAACGGLWQPAAACGSLWHQAVAPIYYHPQALRLAGWLDGWMAGWLDGWMAGWLDGWMEVVGITAVT